MHGNKIYIELSERTRQVDPTLFNARPASWMSLYLKSKDNLVFAKKHILISFNYIILKISFRDRERKLPWQL